MASRRKLDLTIRKTLPGWNSRRDVLNGCTECSESLVRNKLVTIDDYSQLMSNYNQLRA